MAKKGRPTTKPYRDSHGNDHVGLYRRGDGRFSACGDANKTFGTDETEAIRKFHEWKSRRERSVVSFAETMTDLHQFELALRGGHEVVTGPNGTMPEGATINKRVDEAAYWARVARDLRERPKLVAQKVGIEQVAYLRDLQEPPKPLSLKAIRELYVSKKFSDATEGSRSMKYWDEFVKAVRPSTTVNEITNGQLEDYGAKIRTLKLSDKTVENRYNKVASILKFAWMMLKEHRTTIDSLRAEFRLVCRANGNSEGSPDPIDVEDFHWLYKASDEKWRAVLLLMLNTAMHPGECLSTLKGDVDLRRGQLDNRRKKTGKYRRVAILWPETIAAIQAYQALQANNSLYQDAEHLFLTKDDKPYAPRGATEYYRETLKPRAEKIAGRKLTCTLDCIRDGAQNAADDGGADPLHTAMLMGHALPGVMGSYKMRVPSKTQKSVDCIREHYRIVALSVKRSHTSVSKSGD